MAYNLAKLTSWKRDMFSQKENYCVFISHKKEDEAAAITIGTYLTDVVGVNIYLDTQDILLKEAVSTENDQKIVESIQTGLACSTHLLCLISDKTKLSWWVPYEIGFADKQKIDIAALKLKDIDDIPSYIKIRKTLFNMEDFLRYISGLGRYGSLFAEENYIHFSSADNKMLTDYID